MRLLLFIFLFGLTTSIFGQENDTHLVWHTNLEKAQKIAKKENKNILVYFTGSDWCAPCKMLKKDFFDSEKFQSLAKNLVLVLVDYPRRVDIISEKQLEYNKKIISKYNTEKTFPKLVGVNYKGKEIEEISGYSPLRNTSYHFEFLEKISK